MSFQRATSSLLVSNGSVCTAPSSFSMTCSCRNESTRSSSPRVSLDSRNRVAYLVEATVAPISHCGLSRDGEVKSSCKLPGFLQHGIFGRSVPV